MCGILGVRRSWLADRDRFARALETLTWRGPDGSASVVAGDWELGVARLAITDPESPQPIRCGHTGRVIVFNGAVTSGVRESRDAAGELATANDAELALARLRRGGPRALTATCGPYAFAIVDPATDEVFLVRDPEGEKPLHVVVAEGRVVAFASSLAALRRLGVDVRLQDGHVAQWFRYGFHLPLQVSGPGWTVRSDLRGAYRDGGDGLVAVASPEAATEAGEPGDLGQRVLAAVDRCAHAEVTVGLALSGGVDSSCLAAALQHHGQVVPAYQFRAEGAPEEERRRARLVATATGHRLREVGGGPELLDALPDLTRFTGLPQGDPSVFAAHAVARAARADGVRVVLSGEGADDLWLGYRRHRVAARLPQRGWRHLPAPALAMTTAGRLARAIAAPTPYDALLEVSPPGFRRSVLDDAARESALPATGHTTSLQRARAVDRSYYLRCDLLPKCDTASMAAGIEARCPFLDPQVLAAPETNADDPRGILGKRALIDAFRGRLPAGVLDRPKLGFGLPLDGWLRSHDAFADLLRDRRTRERDHIRAAGLAAMLDAHRRGRARLGHALYLVGAYEHYLRYLEASS